MTKRNKKEKTQPLDFIVDRLTKSIELATTRERFDTMVLPISKADMPAISPSRGWKFEWMQEIAAGHAVYKLVTKKEPDVIQGLAAFYDMGKFIEMSLLESAPFNIGRNKIYDGVPGNLVAFGCLISKQKGYKGEVGFTSKTVLMEHYAATLGATPLGSQRMGIFEPDAEKLISRYFPNLAQNKENNHE